MQPFLDGMLSDSEVEEAESTSSAAAGARSATTSRSGYAITCALPSSEPMPRRAEGQARRAAHTALASARSHVDVAGRRRSEQSTSTGSSARPPSSGMRGPGAARERDRVAARRRRSSRRRRARSLGEHALDRARVELRPVGEHDHRASTSSPSAASPQRSDAPGPRAQSAQCDERAPGARRARARPATTTISATLVWRSAASTAGSSSRCLTPPYRVEAPAASTIALARTSTVAFSISTVSVGMPSPPDAGSPSLPIASHDRQALRTTLPSDRVVGRQLRVGGR